MWEPVLVARRDFWNFASQVKGDLCSIFSLDAVKHTWNVHLNNEFRHPKMLNLFFPLHRSTIVKTLNKKYIDAL